MHAQFNIKELCQTRGIVLDYTAVREGNLQNIIIDMARPDAWFATPGKVKCLSWNTVAFCTVMAAYTRLQILGEFAL